MRVKLILVIGLLSAVSCNKYDNGSNFSLRTAKNRLVGEWSITSFKVNEVEQIFTLPEIDMTFDNNYDFKMVQTVSGQEIINEGTWEFYNDKKGIIVHNTTASSTDTFEILELRYKKLELKQTTQSSIYDVKLELN